ncbi:hypothetical protein OUZ56_006513 [Daphnia magna]|uniref:Uncharacterized protein n=1 Tax=Daphnia magna TaxID=35525 RepID=A0ABQ9YVV8_9CRUS|nr:hypothetical protein OUZ56_006513 [Daphnia magna]
MNLNALIEIVNGTLSPIFSINDVAVVVSRMEKAFPTKPLDGIMNRHKHRISVSYTTAVGENGSGLMRCHSRGSATCLIVKFFYWNHLPKRGLA